MKYFQIDQNGNFMEISEEIYEAGGPIKAVLFFIAKNGTVQVKTGLDSPIRLLEFDGLFFDDERIDDDEINEGYLRMMRRLALQDEGDTMHELFRALENLGVK